MNDDLKEWRERVAAYLINGLPPEDAIKQATRDMRDQAQWTKGQPKVSRLWN
jgi:hypothetical protein